MLNVARYDVFKLSEAVLSGQVARVQRMLDGLQAEGEAEVLVHWALAEDIRALKRVKDAMNAGKPCPWRCAKTASGAPGAAYERLLPQASDAAGAPAAIGACGGRHRQGLKQSRLATGRLAGAVAPGAAAVPPGALKPLPAPAGALPEHRRQPPLTAPWHGSKC